MNGKNIDLTIFIFSVMWLEKYIEKANFFSNWKQRQQTNPNSYIKWKPNACQALANLGTNLQIEFANNGKGKDKKSPEFREAAKNEFYKWINAVKVDNSCCKELKLVLWGVYEVIKDKEGGYKLHRSAENAKPEVDRNSPEYQKQLQNLFSSVQESYDNGKAFEENKDRLDGDAIAGKATLEEIINSLTMQEKKSFHFWPQMTDQEKDDWNRKDKGQDSQVDPVLQSWRTTAIAKITVSLTEAKLTNADLEPVNQNWETEISQTENVIEIINIQKLVLNDIKKKKKKKIKTLLPVGKHLLQQFWRLEQPWLF